MTNPDGILECPVRSDVQRDGGGGDIPRHDLRAGWRGEAAGILAVVNIGQVPFLSVS